MDFNKEERQEHEEEILPIVTLPPPPDGGWGWIIVFAGFTINFLGNGSIMSLGIFFESFINHFETSYQAISVANSICFGVYMCFMPINSALVNLFGCKKVCFIGGILFSLGFFLTTITSNIYVFCLTYGIIMGWSGGLALLSWMALVAFYFEKKRALANAICTSGAPIGAAVWSPFGNYLLRSFGWKITFYVFGGINLLTCVLAFLLKPLELVPRTSEKTDADMPLGDKNQCSASTNQTVQLKESSNIYESNVYNVKYRRDRILKISQIGQEITSTDSGYVKEKANTYSRRTKSEPTIQNKIIKRHNKDRTNFDYRPTTNNTEKNIDDLAKYNKSGISMISLQTNSPIADNARDAKARRTSVIVFGVSDEAKLTLRPVNGIFSRRNSNYIVRPFSRIDTFYDRSLNRLVSDVGITEREKPKIKMTQFNEIIS